MANPTIPIQVTSPEAFRELLDKSRTLVAFFYTKDTTHLSRFARTFEQLAVQLSGDQIAFATINGDSQEDLRREYAMDLARNAIFVVFRNGKMADNFTCKEHTADIPGIVADLVREAAASSKAGSQEAEARSSESGSSNSLQWPKAELPKGYSDVTDQVDLKGLELLNSDSKFGGVRTLVVAEKPSALSTKGKAGEGKKDWVESDTDEQLMLFMPFQAQLKIHTLHLTSLPPSSSEGDEEIPMRPKTINLYTNTPHILGFEEAEGIPATQSITLSASDWDATGTATVPLRFVKFQNVTSLVLFVVDGDGDGERVRLDRIRIIGETGEKRDQGKLEKIDHDH